MIKMEDKKKEQKIIFNVSASSMNLYLNSELLFYARYINPQESDTYVTPVYGLAGNVVHECLEYYVKHSNENYIPSHAFIYTLFDEIWAEYDIKNHKGLFNSDFTKKKPDYKIALQRGLMFIDEMKENGYTLYSEKEYFYPIIDNKSALIKFHGFIDLIAIKDKEVLIFDYKTSSSKDNSINFKRQGMLYSWFVKKELKLKTPPKVTFLYLKIENPSQSMQKVVTYSNKEINEHITFLKSCVKDILDKGFDVNKYSLGNYEDNIFNDKVKFCKEQEALRIKQDT